MLYLLNKGGERLTQDFVFSTYWKDKHTSDVIISKDRKSVYYKMYPHNLAEVPFEFDNQRWSRCMILFVRAAFRLVGR